MADPSAKVNILSNVRKGNMLIFASVSCLWKRCDSTSNRCMHEKSVMVQDIHIALDASRRFSHAFQGWS
eukprot:12417303-Karenia_brevis.AAC.1